MPWCHYGIDFGANVWRPAGGLDQAAERNEIDRAFALLAASAIRHVRWFLFCDGRAGIVFDAGGRPSGVDDFVFRDVDAALEAAARHGISVMFVLLDFLWCGDPRVIHGAQLGGHAEVLRSGTGRAALLDCVFTPLFERYGTEPNIFAWDIINEPEWIKTVALDDLDRFLHDCVALVHSSTRHQATVGSAGVRWRDRYWNLELDFYQVHWYDKLRRQPSLDTHVTTLGYDRPVLLGEFPTRGSKKSPNEIIEIARAAGYAGAFSWSALSDDECSAGTLQT